jgi:hypothetical protein
VDYLDLDKAINNFSKIRDLADMTTTGTSGIMSTCTMLISEDHKLMEQLQFNLG